MSSDIIKLNVGGVPYITTRSTLTRYPDSMLGAMFNGAMPTSLDEEGRYFIDRDGALFIHVLNYLRSSKLSLPDDFKQLSQLMTEADFYQIEPLIDELHLLNEFPRPGASTKDVMNNYMEILEIHTCRSIDQTTIGRRTTIAGRRDVIDMLPMEVRRATSGTVSQSALAEYVKLDLMGDDVRACMADFLQNNGWDLRCTRMSTVPGTGAILTIITQMTFGKWEQ